MYNYIIAKRCNRRTAPLADCVATENNRFQRHFDIRNRFAYNQMQP